MGAKTADRIRKSIRVTIAKEHLRRFNHDENKCLNCIVTKDEMWVHYGEPETKAQSKQWKRAGFPALKRFKLSPPADYFMWAAFLGLMQNNNGSFHVKLSYCDC